jgi:hypothetical protein
MARELVSGRGACFENGAIGYALGLPLDQVIY